MVGQAAEEAAEIGAGHLEADRPGLIATFVDQGVAIRSDGMDFLAPRPGDSASSHCGINQILHPGSCRLMEDQGPRLSQSGREFREEADQI